MYDPDTTYAFGAEGLSCPRCGARATYDHDDTVASPDRFPAQCPNTMCEVDSFYAGFADPQCGECREFLDDPTAEDDSLCPKCEKKAPR